MIKRLGDISLNSMYQSITTIRLDYIKCDLTIILVMFKVYSDYQWLSIFQSRIRDCLKHSSSQNVLCGSYIAKFTPNLFWLIYSASTKNVNVTIFKINIKAHIFCSSAPTIHNKLFWLCVKRNCSGTGVDQTIYQR